MDNKQHPSDQELIARYKEVAENVSNILRNVVNKEEMSYLDIAREAMKFGPATLAMLMVVLTRMAPSVGTNEDIDGVITGILHEEVLQNAPTMSVVQQQRRLH